MNRGNGLARHFSVGSKLLRSYRPTVEVLEDRHAPGSLLSITSMPSRDSLPLALSENDLLLTKTDSPVQPSVVSLFSEQHPELWAVTSLSVIGMSTGDARGEWFIDKRQEGPPPSLASKNHYVEPTPDISALDTICQFKLGATGDLPFVHRANSQMAFAQRSPLVPEICESGTSGELISAEGVRSSEGSQDVSSPNGGSAADKQSVIDSFRNMGPRFEENVGQFDEKVDFLVRGLNLTVYLTGNELVLQQSYGSRQTTTPSGERVLSESGHVLRMEFVGGNLTANHSGIDPFEGTTNYFIGSDQTRWRPGVHNFGRVHYDDVYPGVDVDYHAAQDGSLEYDFVAEPGVDPSPIRLRFSGADGVRISEDGELVIGAGHTELVKSAPILYQQSTNGQRHAVSGSYRIEANGDVGFAIGSYDPSLPLVIDPTLGYSTYLGGSSEDKAFDLALDSSNNVYVTGLTRSTGFPTSTGAYDTTLSNQDIFVTKMNSAGSAISYSTFVGGTDFTFNGELQDIPGGQERGLGIALDSSGRAYVTGATASGDFPVTNTASSGSATSRSFLFKLSSDGTSLLYSTYIGRTNTGTSGEDIWAELLQTGFDVAVNSSGVAFVVGETGGTTTTGDPEGDHYHVADAWLSVIDTTTATNTPTTHWNIAALIGSSPNDAGMSADTATSVVWESANEKLYITGFTASSDFPTTSGAYQTSLATTGSGQSTLDAFVAMLDYNGPTAISADYCTFIGGIGTDRSNAICIDSSGGAYITGYSSGSYPTTSGAYRTTSQNGAVVTKLNSTGSSLVYSTYADSSSELSSEGFDIVLLPSDDKNRVWITGITIGDTPTTNDAFQSSSGGEDGFVTRLNQHGTALVYSSYLGSTSQFSTDSGQGIAVDTNSKPYVAGYTNQNDFPITTGAFDETFNGVTDAFVTRF